MVINKQKFKLAMDRLYGRVQNARNHKIASEIRGIYGSMTVDELLTLAGDDGNYDEEKARNHIALWS